MRRRGRSWRLVPRCDGVEEYRRATPLKLSDLLFK
jgi:hypothetical protein